MINITQNQFGGAWTEEKLVILKNYLDAYTTVFKKQWWFKLLYIDAFAGTGRVEQGTQDPDENDRRAFIDGSARIALNIVDRLFDKLIIIETDQDKCSELENLKENNPDRNIRIVNADANDCLPTLKKHRRKWRGVLFLDPFGAQVDWDILRTIAGYKAIDIWILFPTFAIRRMLPTSRLPDDISPKWAGTLTRVFGNESWRSLYEVSPQLELFNDPQIVRQPGDKKLLELYKNRLKELFGDRFLERSRTLRNSRNSPMYEFMFCVGSDSERAIGAAKGIAEYLLGSRTKPGL